MSLPAPYLDFALVALTEGESRERVEAAREALEASLFHVTLFRHGSGHIMLVTSDPEREGRAGEASYGLSGLCMDRERIFVPWVTPSFHDFKNIDAACGQFSSYLIREGEAFVATDAFGYGASYISQHAGSAVASNRLHLHVMVMRAFQLTVALAPVAVTATLFSDHGFFSQQSALSQTLVAGVTKVPVDRDVLLGAPAGRAVLVPKRSLEAAFAPVSTYEVLLDTGVERLIQNARVALEASMFENLLLELSGGKDTRLVLASMMHTPGWAGRLRLKTRGVEGDSDVTIASGIASLFGLTFFRGSQVEQYPLSIQENIDFWRSYYFGEYHRFAGDAWSVAGHNRSDLAVGGANGEVYRSFWSDVIRRDVALGGSLSDFSQRFVGRVALPDVFEASAVHELGEALSQELEQGMGPSLEGYVEDHYLRHRNRSHCGMRGYSVMHEQLIWYPLMAPELFAASRIVTFETRRSGQLIHDILLRLNPLLLDIPLDGPDPFVDVDKSKVAPVWEQRLQVRLDPSVDKWREADEEEARRRQLRRGGRLPTMAWSQFSVEMSRQFSECLDELSDSEAVNEAARASLRRRFLMMRETNIRSAYQLASRVFAVLDVLG